MDELSVLKGHTKHLYKRAGQLNLYLHFHCEARAFDTKRLKHEIEEIKRTVSNIENIIENK